MIQVCDPPRTRQVRRLSTEEFCQLVRGEVSCVYRPRSEVLRMLTVGETWGTGGVRGAPGAGCILLPMDADVAAAAALRRFLGWGCTAGGYFSPQRPGRTAVPPGPCTAAGCCRRPAGTAGPGPGAGGLWWSALPKKCCRCTCGRGSRCGLSAAGQSGPLLLAAGGLSGTEPAAGLGAAGRPGAHCHPAGPGLCALESRESPQGTVLALYPV